MTTTNRKFGFATRQLHAGQVPDPTTGAAPCRSTRPPATSSGTREHAANLFALKESGNIYTRIMNPTTDVLEQRLADLEGGVGALAASSGHAAQTLVVLTLCAAGDHIVSSSRLYGGTYNQFTYTFPRLGIEVTFVDPADPGNFEKAIRPNTKILYGETLGNPDISVFPFEEVAAIAKKHNIPLVIDNTFATPYLCRPFEWGANIITHSTTKFIGGHGTCIGGVIVDGGNFDWTSGRFANFTNAGPFLPRPGLCRPGPHGLPPFITKARVQVLRDIGACQSSVQQLADHPGHRDAQPAHGAPRAERPGGGRIPGSASVGQLGEISRPEEPSGLRAGEEILAKGARRDPGIRRQRRPGSRQAVHREPAALQPPGECGRCQEPGHPPGHDHPQPVEPKSSSCRRASPRTSSA